MIVPGYLNQKFFTQYYENDQTTTTAKYQLFSRNCGCPTPTYRFLNKTIEDLRICLINSCV
jgi:hypothetical protein